MIKLKELLNESLSEAQKVNPTSKKFLKGMKKIKVKGLGGWMPGVDYVYVDGNTYYFVDSEGDHMELRNISTIKKLHKLHGNELGESVHEANNLIESKLNEAIGIVTLLAATTSVILGVWTLLQTFSALLYIRHRHDRKDADTRYADLMAWWEPKKLYSTWKLVKSDKQVAKIVTRLKDDMDIKNFLKNPKQQGWQKMLNGKLSSSEKTHLQKIYKKHFADKMNESVNEANDTYFKAAYEAAQYAREMAEKKGYEIDEDDWQTQIGMGGKYNRLRPGVGKTHSFTVGLTKNGKPQRKALNISLYGMDSGSYELTYYIN